MIMQKSVFRIFALLILVLILGPTVVYGISIGVSPSKLSFPDMLAGGYSEKTVTVSTNFEENLTAHYTVEGNIKEWIRFEPNETIFVFSKAVPYKPKIIVEPPNNIRNGTYSGNIYFVTDYIGNVESRAGGIVKVAVGFNINVDITNKEISRCKGGGLDLKDNEVGYPIELRFTVTNEGNVRIKPKVSVDIWDQLQENIVLSREITSDEVLPTITRNIFKGIPINLDIGQYWATVSVPECGVSDLLTFSIVEKGAIIDKGVLNQITNSVWAFVNEPIEIKADFRNTGERAVFARFKGTVKLDDKIVKILETEEIEVPAGEKADLTAFFIPEQPGRYVISGKVIYNKKFTFEKGSILNVNPNPETAKGLNFGKFFPLIVYLIIVITIIFILRKIIKEKRKRRF